MSKVKITDTILRDAHQSLIATRMKLSDIEPALEMIDKVGFNALEMWGGATFDACIRFLNEDPWERLRVIRSKCKNTQLMMLLRGQNLLGYKHYPDDVVIEFVKLSVKNGIDIIRIFDALNDLRNLETAIKATKEAGAHAQGTVVYTISPVHDNKLFVSLAKDLKAMGSDSICIKDMAGILKPYIAYDLVKAIKAEVDLPLEIHTHYTSGMGSMMYLKSIEAGADIIDTAMSPFALGASQPPTESIVSTLQDTEYDTGLDIDLLAKIADYFKEVKKNYSINQEVLSIDTEVLKYQIPGGMLSNLVSQLSESNALDRYPDVLKEAPIVRADLGYPPLVTPTSQIVGTQAVLNVITGSRYKMVPQEVKDYVKGLYGKPPVEISPEIRKKIIGDAEVIKQRPADLLEPKLDDYRKEIAAYTESPEDVMTYALFPQVGKKFLMDRKSKKDNIDYDLVEKSADSSEKPYYPV